MSYKCNLFHPWNIWFVPTATVDAWDEDTNVTLKCRVTVTAPFPTSTVAMPLPFVMFCFQFPLTANRFYHFGKVPNVTRCNLGNDGNPISFHWTKP